MFKKKSPILAFLILVIPILFVMFSGVALAQSGTVIDEDINKTAGDLEIPADTTVNGNVTLNAGSLEVFGVVNGNVGNNMGEVKISGDVNGNVETNMGAIEIPGSVSGNVKTRMGEINISGSVGGNVENNLGSAQISGAVGGNIGSGFGELTISGTVAGDINSTAGNVVINGIVEGDVILDQGVVELGPSAIVSGKIYVGRGTVKKAQSAVAGTVEIGEETAFQDDTTGGPAQGYHFDGIDERLADEIVGRVNEELDRTFRDRNFMPWMDRGWNFSTSRFPFVNFYGSLSSGIINMLILFALAALTFTLFPKQVQTAGEAISIKPGPVLGWGLLAAILAVPLMILLVITLIGIPLVLVEIILLAAAAIFGYTGITLLLGNRIIQAASSKQVNPLGSIAIGVLVLGLISMIPVLGGLLSITIFIVAIGAVLVTRFGMKNSEPGVAVAQQSVKINETVSEKDLPESGMIKTSENSQDSEEGEHD